MKCPECNNEMIDKKVGYRYKGKYFGEYNAEVCIKCKDIYFTEESFKEIEKRAKELGVWGKDARKK